MVLGEGVEPPKTKSADLQSAAFDHFATPASSEYANDLHFVLKISAQNSDLKRLLLSNLQTAFGFGLQIWVAQLAIKF